MGRYPTSTLAEKTGLRASIAREQVWGFFLRFVFCLLSRGFCLFCCWFVDVDFGAEFVFDRRKELLELALGFGDFVALVLDLSVEVVDDVDVLGALGLALAALDAV